MLCITVYHYKDYVEEVEVDCEILCSSGGLKMEVKVVKLPSKFFKDTNLISIDSEKST